MSGFYYNQNNFERLCNEVSILLSNTIMESTVAEGWLEDFYVSDRYNTTRAIERYSCDVLVNKITQSNLNKLLINSTVNKAMDMIHLKESSSLENLLCNLKSIQDDNISRSAFIIAVESFTLSETLEYLKERLAMEDPVRNFHMKYDGVKNLLTITESLKRIVRKNPPGSDIIYCIKEEIDKFLYCYKSYSYEGEYNLLGAKEGVSVQEADNMTCDDVRFMFSQLDSMLDTNPDHMIGYVLEELRYIDRILLDKEKEIAPITESYELDIMYNKGLDEFNYLIEDIFFTDNEIKLKDAMRLITITEALIDYEDTMEATSRIITKGTEKVTRAISNTSARSTGIGKANSKVDQIKRGARIADERASGAINKKLDDIINTGRELHREKIITGKNTVQLGNLLKKAIKLLITGAVTKAYFGPIKGVIVMVAAALAGTALSKRTKEREKKRILLELETELKIVREKIEDAKGDNEKQKKYQLMRIEADLEKEVMRIKHGMRYY